jgi:hypothetical protein
MGGWKLDVVLLWREVRSMTMRRREARSMTLQITARVELMLLESLMILAVVAFGFVLIAQT